MGYAFAMRLARRRRRPLRPWERLVLILAALSVLTTAIAVWLLVFRDAPAGDTVHAACDVLSAAVTGFHSALWVPLAIDVLRDRD